MDPLKQVYIIGHSDPMLTPLVRGLEQHAFKVRLCPNSESSIQDLPNHSPDLVIVDQQLPDRSCLDVISKLQKNHNGHLLPIVVVSDPVDEEHRLSALNLGADDFIMRPFSMRELVARCRVILRRAGNGLAHHSSPVAKLFNGSLAVDYTSRQLFLGSNEVALTHSEFNILTELIRYRGKVVTRNYLIQRALKNKSVTHRTVDVHISSIRKKLGTLGCEIRTVHGIGFRLTCPEAETAV